MSLYDDSNPQHLEYLARHQAARQRMEKKMIDPQAVEKAAQQFNAACDAYDAHEAITREQSIDLAIAERSGNLEDIAAAQAARKSHGNNWHGCYTAKQDTAEALIRATGVDPRKVAGAIKRY